MTPRDITPGKIERAKTFLRQPMEDLFKTPMPLRDTDRVTLKFSELAHLLAWYSELGNSRPPGTTASPDQQALHAHTTKRLVAGNPFPAEPAGREMTEVKPRG